VVEKDGSASTALSIGYFVGAYHHAGDMRVSKERFDALTHEIHIARFRHDTTCIGKVEKPTLQVANIISSSDVAKSVEHGIAQYFSANCNLS
jgi:hypothetical protein